jgi:hypothetical protein
MMMSGLTHLYLALGDLVAPLRRRVDTLEGLESLAHRYGWNASLDETTFAQIGPALNITTPLGQFRDVVVRIRERFNADSDVQLTTSDLATLIPAASSLLRALAGVGPSSLDGLIAPYDQSEFWDSLAEHLVDDLLEEYLRVYQPCVYSVLRIWGVIRFDETDPGGEHRRPYKRISLDWDRLIDMVRDPVGGLRHTYHWSDGAPLDHQGALLGLAEGLRVVGVSSTPLTPAIDPRDPFSAHDAAKIHRGVAALRALLFSGASSVDGAMHRIGFEVFPASRLGEMKPRGFLIKPLLEGSAEAEIPLGSDFVLRWRADASASGAAGISLFPESVDLIGGDVAIGTRVEIASNSAGPTYLLGTATTSHISVSDLEASFELAGTVTEPEIIMATSAKGNDGQPGCRILVSLDGSDAFVKGFVNRAVLDFVCSPSLMWSSRRGLSFQGMPTFDIELPLNVGLGPVTITRASISLGTSANADAAVLCRVGVGLIGRLGPIDLVIEQIGFAITVTRYTAARLRHLPEDEAPCLAGLALDLGFAPPTGVGLGIDAKVISGRGYLEAFPERGEYLGFAQLTLKNKIAVNAYGVILTKPQVSFLLVISADFPPIQLGLGFRLTGVGGIVGIHRRLDGQRLLDGLRDNLLNEVLFPQDPFKDPHGLVSNVAALFPPSEGEHVFGPTALVTWGPRDLVRIKVALVLEFPAFRISTFGVLQARLAKRVAGKDLLVLELQVNFAGMFDFEEGFVRFDAALYQSRLLGLTLDGEMAWRLRYGGSSPDLVMTLGGFHPAFQPPALALPANLRRLQLTLASGNPHIWVDAYFAVTSNTIQFGAAGHLRFNKWGVGISGDLGFDALFQFIPFRFEAGVFFFLNASWKGVDFTSIEITGTFSGPSPWRVKGEFKLKICWFLKISVPIDESWGDSDESTLGEVEILPLLVEDVGSARNWERAPGQTSLLVTCRATQTATEELMLHPNDLLAVRQNTVPLGLRIDKFGERRPKDASRFRIKLKRGGELVEGVPLRTHFAPAQFFERNEEDRLSASSYEFLEAGEGFDDLDAVVFDAWTTQDVTYESEYVDDPSLTPADTLPPAPEPSDRFRFALLNNAVANSRLGRLAKPKPTLKPIPMTEGYVVADPGGAVDEPLVARSEAEARELLRELRRRNPRRRLDVDILPLSDVLR